MRSKSPRSQMKTLSPRTKSTILTQVKLAKIKKNVHMAVKKAKELQKLIKNLEKLRI